MKKDLIVTVTGLAGSTVTTLFGGWSTGMTTLLIFMAIDYVSGLAVAGIFKKSTKTDSGALESRAGLKGLCRKGMMLLIVLVAHRIDLELGTNYCRDASTIALCLNEAISIIENAGLMGIKIPKPLQNAIDLFRKKISDKEE